MKNASLLEQHEMNEDFVSEEKKVYDKDIQDKIRDLISSKKVLAKTIAKGVNVSSSTISLYLSSNYNGDVVTLENELKKYLGFFNKREETDNKSLKFCEINTVKKIFNAANMCQLKGKMGVCYGLPGIGKTTAINEYQRTLTGVIVVDPIENTSVRAVLQDIADQLKLNYYQNITLEEFTSNVIKKLEKNKHLIIIDEAENLKVDIFKILRKIHDKTNNSCGILFVGTYELFELLKKVKNGFPYITSRIGYITKIDSLSLSDVESLVVQYYPNCSKELIKTIAVVSHYNARAVQNLLDLCLEITTSEKIELSVDVIDASREKLLI
ncbi:AAA family ATPase [bacterium]|nr:AAA family ATPase [bacterium]